MHFLSAMPQQVIICGFHRSGTSMSAQALSRGGLYLGDSLISADPSNPDGHFEDIETVNLHNAWLAQNNRDWCCIHDLPNIGAAQALQELSPIVQRLALPAKHWGIKDPRATLFLTQWQQVLEQPVYIMAYRHYASCLDSLRRRQARELLVNPKNEHQAIRFWQTPDVALRSWILHNNAILAHMRKCPESCLLLSQESQLNGANLLSLANKRFDLGLDADADTGVDVTKASKQKNIALPAIDAELQAELDTTWQQLQLAAEVPAQQHANVQWKTKKQLESDNVLDSLAAVCRALAVSDTTVYQNQNTITSDIETADSPTTPSVTQVDTNVTAESLLETTDISSRPQVHAAMRQLSETGQLFFLRDALKHNTNDPFINMLLGIRYLNAGQLTLANTFLNIAAKEDNASVWFHLGLLRQREGNLTKAIGFFEKAVAKRANPDHFVLLIRVCLEHNALNKAIKHQELARTTYPTDTRFVSYQAQILCAQGKQEEALQTCLSNDEQSASSALIKQACQILVDLGRGGEAQALYKQAMLRDITQQDHFHQRAVAVLSALPADQAQILCQFWREQANALISVKSVN